MPVVFLTVKQASAEADNGLMTCVLRILVFAVFFVACEGRSAQSLPCMRKLVSSGDRNQDTAELIQYLGLLVERKVVTVQDLEKFIVHLEQGKVTNPVPTRAEMRFEFHYDEFQKLLKIWDLDHHQIREWFTTLIEKIRSAENSKQFTQQNSEVIPVYLGIDGSRIYRVNHPKMGEVYRILKPRGHYEREGDWENLVWRVGELKGAHTNAGSTDQSYQLMVSDESLARKACLEIGLELPKMVDYHQILSRFDHYRSDDHTCLTEKGLIEYRKLFPDSASSIFWTKTIHHLDLIYAWMFNGRSGCTGYSERHFSYSVRCVGTWQGR